MDLTVYIIQTKQGSRFSEVIKAFLHEPCFHAELHTSEFLTHINLGVVSC